MYKLQSLERLSNENKKLRVFDLDPLDYHSIMEALKGCYGLFYSFELPSDNPTYDEFIGEIEVRAAHNVLEACARTDTIDKLILTSSATAVIWRDQHNSVPSDVDERS
ncbi:cinnamoyl-CoA reductase-like SNL6 [Olea europaea var. sylvestris]|uniref:cinnamoyl-CoA reductase-like SNL6 n=1 Tax=Olea europaea var. sylvestris TaxID=158386 RepID=UPI000C1D195F|nr:cinnamoyl-CoA reductase-like SNL6 [Olea europaea var. sylvestris]